MVFATEESSTVDAAFVTGGSGMTVAVKITAKCPGHRNGVNAFLLRQRPMCLHWGHLCVPPELAQSSATFWSKACSTSASRKIVAAAACPITGAVHCSLPVLVPAARM